MSSHWSELDSEENQKETADKLQVRTSEKIFMNNLSFSENHQE